ncbi:MAG: outer membrane lipoprotein-sorting protein [Myxococcota bacterium]|nr:outer membrane lipoprotein-sorting protein [Myxococcota bacterium]
MIRFPIALSIVLLLSLPTLAPAGAGELTADQIIARSTANQTVKNSVQTMTMTIVSRKGEQRVRKITSKIKKADGGVTKSYVRFDEPADYEGVQFLTIENPQGEDDQWLFAAGVLNRISGGKRHGSFMGSDFSFEDLSVGSNPDDGTHTLVGEDTIEVGGSSVAVYKVQTVPKPELGSAYTRFIAYIAKGDFMPRSVEFFDKKDELAKRMTLVEVKPEGDLRIPIKTTMENLKRGTRTEIVVENYQVNVPASDLPDEVFTPDFLESEG